MDGYRVSKWASIVLLLSSTTNARAELSCSHIHAYDKQQVVLQNTRCYHLAQESLSWNDAAVRCRTNNGALASIPDTEVNGVLLELSTNLDYNNLANVSFYWIGGRVLSRGKGVTWLQDPGTKFVAFNDGEPQGFDEFGCLLLDPGTGGWATDICQAELELVGYICEYPSKEKEVQPSVTSGTQSQTTSLMELGTVSLCVTIIRLDRSRLDILII